MKELTSVYGTHVLKRIAMKKWVDRFRSGRESVGNDARAGQPVIEKVNGEIKKDC